MGATRNLRKVLPALLALIAITAGCRIDMHDAALLPAHGEERFFCRRSLRPLAGRRHGGARRSPRRHLLLHRKNRQRSGRLSAVPGDRRSSRPRTRALQHQLHALSRTRRRWQWIHSHARIPPSAVVSHRSSAQSADRLLLRRHDQRLRRDARIWHAGCAARSLVHRGLHPRAATEPECNLRATFPQDKKFRHLRRSSATSATEPRCPRSRPRRPPPQKGSPNDHGHSEDD